MHQIERIMRRAKLCVERGEPLPLDLLVEADIYGLHLSIIEDDAVISLNAEKQKEEQYGTTVPKVHNKQR